MSTYIKIDKNDIENVELILSNNNITFKTNDDPLYYMVENTVGVIVKNNLLVNNNSELDDMLDFIYEDFNKTMVMEEIINKMITYENQNVTEVC